MKATMAWCAAALLASVAAGCNGQSPATPGTRAGIGNIDPLGISLDLIGLVGGDAPCGEEDHVASVVDDEGRYTAFCRSTAGSISIVHVARADQELVSFAGRNPMDVYTELTPSGTDVPEALVDDPTLGVPGRSIVSRSVAYVAPGAIPASPIGVDDLAERNACDDRDFFEEQYCAYVANEAEIADADAVARCDSARRSWLRRTASIQAEDLGTEQEARIVVAACGTRPTRVYEYAMSGVDGEWSAAKLLSLQPAHVLFRSVATTDFDEERADGSLVSAIDLRFYVETGPLAWFRAAEAFGELPNP